MTNAAADFPLPTRIGRVDGDIEMHWSDGSIRRYSPAVLREACPCAGCREKRAAPAPSPLRVLAPEDLVPLTIRGMQPVGQYAYSIDFSDGHDTGIYTLDLLRTLGSQPHQESSHPDATDDRRHA